MERVSHSGSWYEPPEQPTQAMCESCGEVFDIDDMHAVDDYWADHLFCKDCWVECARCGQQDGKIYMRRAGDSWVCEDCDEG